MNDEARRDEFREKILNNPADAMLELYDKLEAAELNQAVIMGGDGTASEVL